MNGDIVGGKMGIFEAQYPPMPMNLHVFMKILFSLKNSLHCFVDVGSCGATLFRYLEVLVLVEQHSLHLTHHTNLLSDSN